MHEETEELHLLLIRSERELLAGYLFRDFLDGSNRGHVEMATPALEVDEEAIFDAALDGLLGRLHQLCTWNKGGRIA